MTNKIKALIEILCITFLGAAMMVVLKILSPEYGEYIFWTGFLVVYVYFAYTYKVASMELKEFLKSLKSNNND